MGHYIYKLNIVKTVLYEFKIKQAQYTVCPKTSMKLHDCEAIEIESVKEVSNGLESVKKALRKCKETNKRFP